MTPTASEKELLDFIEERLSVLRRTYGDSDRGKVAGARWLAECIKDFLTPKDSLDAPA